MPCTSGGIPIVSGPSVGVPVVGGGGPVAVLPLGALTGDGTLCHPLGVIVDNSTIVINGSNQLAAAGSGIPYFVASQIAEPYFEGVAPFGGFVIPVHTTLGTIAGIPNSIIVPVKFAFAATQHDNLGVPDNAVWSPETGVEVVYNVTGTPAVCNGNIDLLYIAVGAHNGSSIQEPVGSNIITNTYRAFVGADVIVRTGNVSVANSTSLKFISNSYRWALAYAVIPG